ncbi:4Fe-4S dicluster domain-containing protein [Thermodesulfobacteriota bacterium]
MTRYGMVIDLARCTGCYACVVACKSENSTRPGVSWIRIEEQEEGEYPQVSRRYIPFLCMQCGEIPCARVCPTQAIVMGDDGIVRIESGKCVCGESHRCIDACPFQVLQVNAGKQSYFPDYVASFEKEAYEAHRDGLVEKCTLCSHKIGDGELPACVQACPTQAMIFGDRDDPDSPLSKLALKSNVRVLGEELKLKPTVLYKF